MRVCTRMYVISVPWLITGLHGAHNDPDILYSQIYTPWYYPKQPWHDSGRLSWFWQTVQQPWHDSGRLSEDIPHTQMVKNKHTHIHTHIYRPKVSGWLLRRYCTGDVNRFIHVSMYMYTRTQTHTHTHRSGKDNGVLANHWDGIAQAMQTDARDINPGEYHPGLVRIMCVCWIYEWGREVCCKNRILK
jgi:hypothetical protein